MDTLLLMGLAFLVGVVVVVLGNWTFSNRRSSGGTTVTVDSITVGLTGTELQAVIRGMTAGERAAFYRAAQGDVLAGEAFVAAVRRWLYANPQKAAQKGYPLP